MRTFLVVAVCAGLAAIVAGSLLRRLGWGHAWVVTASGNLIVRLGSLVVFISIAVFGFHRGGSWYALGILFALLSLAGALIYTFWAVALFGSTALQRRLAHALLRIRSRRE